MDAALVQIKQLATKANQGARWQLMAALRKLADSMESPNDTIHRYGHMVNSPKRFEVAAHEKLMLE
jgi:hypothetical protein